MRQGPTEYKVVGLIPYKEADAALGMPAGNIFTCRIVNADIESKSDLPSGKIAKVTKGDGFNEYTKAAFEDDGSLIVVWKADGIKPLEVKITWSAGSETTYVFDFSESILEPEDE